MDYFEETKGNLREKIINLTKTDKSPGVDIMRNKEDFKYLYEVIDSIKQVWSYIPEEKRSILLNTLCGKRHMSLQKVLKEIMQS